LVYISYPLQACALWITLLTKRVVLLDKIPVTKMVRQSQKSIVLQGVTGLPQTTTKNLFIMLT